VFEILNQSGFLSRIFTFLDWNWCLKRWFKTSDEEELGLRCSLTLAFKVFKVVPVSPMWSIPRCLPTGLPLTFDIIKWWRHEFRWGGVFGALKAGVSEHRRPPRPHQRFQTTFLGREHRGHKYQSEKVKIPEREPDWFRRCTKEAIYIRQLQPSLS